MSFAQAVTNGIAVLGQETLMGLYEGMMMWITVSHETQSLASLTLCMQIIISHKFTAHRENATVPARTMLFLNSARVETINSSIVQKRVLFYEYKRHVPPIAKDNVSYNAILSKIIR